MNLNLIYSKLNHLHDELCSKLKNDANARLSFINLNNSPLEYNNQKNTCDGKST